MFVLSLSQPISQAPDPGCQFQAHPPGGPRLPPCQTDPGAAPPATLFFSACSLPSPNSDPAHLHSTYQASASLFPYTLPFFLSARSFYLPFPIHYITLLYLTFTSSDTSPYNTQHGARRRSITPRSARVLSSSVRLGLDIRS